MDKKEFKRRIYVRPWAEVIKVEAESQLTAGSSEVKFGNGDTTRCIVEPLENGGDEELNCVSDDDPK